MTVPEGVEHRLFSLITGFRASQLVRVAVELGLPERIGAEPVSSDELAQATGTHEPTLRRALRALVALGVFAETAEGRFVESALSMGLRRDAPGGYGELATSVPEGYVAWGHLDEALRSGEPVYPRLFGRTHFETLAQDPALAERFNRAMATSSAADAAAIAAAYPFPARGTVVDVGGGEGGLLAGVLRAHPGLAGVLFDLPAGLAGAPAYLAAQGVAERCTLVAGNFFEALPAGEVYLLRRILHDWDDAAAVAILASCRRAMRGSARLLISELLLPAQVRPGFADERVTMLDLQMLVLLGGRERTEAEYRTLIERAGLRPRRTIATGRPSSLIEADLPEA